MEILVFERSETQTCYTFYILTVSDFPQLRKCASDGYFEAVCLSCRTWITYGSVQRDDVMGFILYSVGIRSLSLRNVFTLFIFNIRMFCIASAVTYICLKWWSRNNWKITIVSNTVTCKGAEEKPAALSIEAPQTARPVQKVTAIWAAAAAVRGCGLQCVKHWV